MNNYKPPEATPKQVALIKKIIRELLEKNHYFKLQALYTGDFSYAEAFNLLYGKFIYPEYLTLTQAKEFIGSYFDIKKTIKDAIDFNDPYLYNDFRTKLPVLNVK